MKNCVFLEKGPIWHKKSRIAMLIQTCRSGKIQRWAPTTTLRALNIFSETLYEE
jgi:hypothetical protein